MRTLRPFAANWFYPCLLVCFLLTRQHAQAQESAAKAVLAPKIVFAITDEIFAPEYHKAPFVEHAEPIPVSDQDRSTKAVRSALAIYPPDFLATNLSTIYVVSHLTFNNIVVGGFGWVGAKSLYINNDGEAAGYTDFKIERMVHHELAHLLYANHPHNIAFPLWQRLNSAGFHYGKGGMDWLKDGRNKASDDLLTNEKFLAQGFIRDYALSDVEEDFACTAEALLSGSPELWLAVDRYDTMQEESRDGDRLLRISGQNADRKLFSSYPADNNRLAHFL